MPFAAEADMAYFCEKRKSVKGSEKERRSEERGRRGSGKEVREGEGVRVRPRGFEQEKRRLQGEGRDWNEGENEKVKG